MNKITIIALVLTIIFELITLQGQNKKEPPPLQIKVQENIKVEENEPCQWILDKAKFYTLEAERDYNSHMSIQVQDRAQLAIAFSEYYRACKGK